MSPRVDEWAPAIAGAAQVVQRPTDWNDAADARGPIQLMVDAARDAASDAGAPGLLQRVDWIGVAGGLWSFNNPGQLVAEQIGAPAARTCLSSISGSAPQEMLGLAAERVARGEIDVALVLGGEARASSLRLRKLDAKPPWQTSGGVGEPERIAGLPEDAIHETLALGAAAPAYALFEDALRHARRETIGAHRDRIAQLWQRFSAVAVDNPAAWDRTPHAVAAIRDPTPHNRMIAFPYTKAMVANNTVDMASAILVCSTEAARAAGVALDKLVFPHVVTTSHDTWRFVHRDVLHEAPALVAAGRAALTHAGIGSDELQHIDLYACFPSIVEMSAAALGLDLDRPLTVTGGLGFAGAPIANSSGQAIAALAQLLRSGGFGLIHANGGSATKHAFGVYADHPPARFRRIDCDGVAELRPRPAVDKDWSGDGTIEAATVIYDRDGPSHLLASLRTTDGERGLVRSSDPDIMTQAMRDGLAGATGPLPGGVPVDLADTS